MRQISEDTKRLLENPVTNIEIDRNGIKFIGTNETLRLENAADQPDATVPAEKFIRLQSEFIRLKMKSEASAIRMSNNQDRLLDALKRCRKLLRRDAEFTHLRDLEFIDETIMEFDD